MTGTRMTYGEPAIMVYEIPDGQSFQLFRIVRSANKDDPVLVNSLRSHYELDHDPPGPTRPAVLHMGLSTYLEIGPARETANRFPRIGSYVAELALKAGNGFNWAMTGHPKHITVWGEPVKLAESVVDIVDV